MLQKIKNKLIIVASLAAILTPVSVMVASPAYAAVNQGDINRSLCNGSNGILDTTAPCDPTPPTTGNLESKIAKVINVLSAVVGVVAIIMVIWGGFRYVTSGGKQESVTAAKNTLLYAIVGLVIVALAQAIVHFVLTKATV